MAKKREVIEHRHHRKPKSRGGGNHHTNLSTVSQKDHQAYHNLFGNMLPDELAAMLTDTWIDPDYYLVAVPRKRKKQSTRRKKMYCIDCQMVVLKPLSQTCKKCTKK